MQPFGRKKIQLPNAKHPVKSNGKHLISWWENIVYICKKRCRRDSTKNIKTEIDMLGE